MGRALYGALIVSLILGQVITHPQGGMTLSALSANLSGFAVDYWPTAVASISVTAHGAMIMNFPVDADPRSLSGQRAGSYLLDYYNRIQIHPASIALGNLVSTQQRPVALWNAWLARAVTVAAVVVDPGSAITVSGQGAPPLDMQPLQELTWQLSISNEGAATIDTAVQWQFSADPTLSVHITGQRVTAWTYVPNWASGITERLEWLTLIERGTNGNEDATPLREWPRRSWEFVPLVEGTDRQRMENMLYDASARTWAVPVWPDYDELAADLALGVLSIPVDTVGLDYHDGGLAILLSDAKTFETVEISTISDSAIALARGTLNAWPAGTRIYPARTARLDAYPSLSRYTTRLVDSTVRFISMGANDYAGTMPTATYRGMSVLEDRPEWSDKPTTQYNRDVALVDNDTGLVLIDDISGLPWPVQSHRWQVYGRTARDALRQLFYALAGKANRLWLPTWQDDLYPTAPLATTNLTVAHSGYTQFLYGQNGRRDIRVELVDGTVLYRRIIASTELDADTEQLQVDSAWPSSILAGDVLSISYMGLCRLDTDAVEIHHINDSDGAAAVAVTFAQATANG
jgi:hypothetical protein